MAQTFSNWNEVPNSILKKINKLLSGLGTACYEKGYDVMNKEITVYKLSNHKVSENTDFLTDEQKLKLFEVAVDHNLIPSIFLDSLTFETECVRIYDEVYYLPGIILGTWPHCNLFGGMDETGYIHT
jgi:hypothetical protein